MHLSVYFPSIEQDQNEHGEKKKVYGWDYIWSQAILAPNQT
jgi:hypothetical protein